VRGSERKLQGMLIRPSRLVRGALALLGVMFVPVAVVFLVTNPRRNWLSAGAMLFVSVVFLFLAFDRREGSWLAGLDDLGSSRPDE